jgi:hypothetical protein
MRHGLVVCPDLQHVRGMVGKAIDSDYASSDHSPPRFHPDIDGAAFHATYKSTHSELTLP